MPKILVSVGYEFPGGEIESLPINSDQSLLDADIIIFRANFEEFTNEKDIRGDARTYQGRRWINEADSFSLKRAITHWKNQINLAYDANKTIIILLPPYEQVYVDTGQREYSGAGRNRQPTIMLEAKNSYDFLPIKIAATPSSGKEIKIQSDLQSLTPLWNFLREHSQYRVTLECETLKPKLFTRSNERVVGGIVGNKNNMILLPDLIVYDSEFITDGGAWSKAAKQFGKRLIELLVELDRSIKADIDTTPAPDWATDANYRLLQENEIQNIILSLDSQIDTLMARRQTETEHLAAAGALRALLYAKGKQLESAVREALVILGFEVSSLNDGEHEFDVIFSSPEARFIGEIEGRDQKGIAIQKLSQLERNIQEDFHRDGVDSYARGVLFGNAERLLPIENRGNFFTDKTITGARRSKIALVRTPDLFRVIKYLKDQPNEEFADKCRKSISDAEGSIVSFPEPDEQA